MTCDVTKNGTARYPTRFKNTGVTKMPGSKTRRTNGNRPDCKPKMPVRKID